MGDWSSCTLDEVIELQRGHDLPSTIRGDGDVPVIGSFGITGFHDVAKYPGPGVAIGRSGASIGVATFCASEYWPLNTCLFVKNFKRNDPRWVFYLLDSIDFSGFNSGSAQPSLNRNYLKSIPILLPSLVEQQAIAGVLSALDDKIESNRRIVKTAREFIDALFCNAFSDGEINVQVSCLAEVVDCLHTKKPDQALDGKQLLQLSNISDDGFLILGNHYPISLDDYNKWTANIEATEGDVILTNVGRVGALARLPKGVKAALGRNLTAIRARQPSDALFIFAALNNAQVRRGMKSLIDVGTIMDALNVHAIRRILLPESTVLQRDGFASAVGDLVERAEVAVKESGGLKSLRDTLLPELLSGRLRVRDTELMMENV